MSDNNSILSPEMNLFQHLRSFIHLTTQAPLEQVCKSSLYILTRAPSTRHAVIEYISTFYRVTTYLHLRFNLNQKKPNYPDIQTDTKNIQQINQVIDYIENSLVELLEKQEINEFWSVELCQPLLELIGDIVLNTAISFADSPGLTPEEVTSFKLPSISDGLEIWNNQCRPTQSILFIIQKCFTLVSSSTKSIIADYVINTSTKYNVRYDWLLCYLSPFNTEILFEKFLNAGFKEYLAFYKTDNQLSQKLSRINTFNFYSLNYSNIILNEIFKFLKNSSEEKKMFILRLASQTPALLIILLNKILNRYEDDGFIKKEVFDMLLKNDELFTPELFNCVKQINNSVAVNDIIFNVMDWIESYDYAREERSFYKIQKIIVLFMDEMISNFYLSQSENLTIEGQSPSELSPFLKSLASISGYSFNLLINKIISIIDNQDKNIFQQNYELIYKIILLIAICEDSNSSIELVTMLLKLTIPKINDTDYVLNKLHLEINPFHPDCFKESIKNAIESLKNEQNEKQLKSLVNNLVIIHEWDMHNQCYINQNVSSIVFERGNFLSFLSLLKLSNNISLEMIELLNKIFNSNEPDWANLKLNISDLITISDILVKHFFDLQQSIEEENVSIRIKELNELIDLIQNISFYQLNNQDESNPFRNILLRNVIDKIFDIIQTSKTSHKDEIEVDYYDENFNLFSKNINLINEELMSNKSKLKAIRSSLIDYPLRILDQQKVKFKSIKYFAMLSLLHVITSDSLDSDTATSKNGKSSLADLLVQKILLEDHFIDYQWPGSSLDEIDDNLDNEIEALKLYIERDMAVQNTFENRVDNNIIWLLLEFISDDEQAFIKAAPLVRSLLASLIIQWESYQEQSTRNVSKTLSMTLRLLNLINRSKSLKKPFCFIVDIILLLNSFETYYLLLIVWKNLKKKINPIKTSNNIILSELNKNNETKTLKYIFHKNIGKLAYLYPKFFLDVEA